MVRRMAYIGMVLAVMALLCIEPAHAYIDPGTGSMIIQALLACGVGVLAFWRQIKTFVSTHLGGKSADSSASDDAE